LEKPRYDIPKNALEAHVGQAQKRFPRARVFFIGLVAELYLMPAEVRFE
jgi:hypothetical protein